jgi:hypothetical protein
MKASVERGTEANFYNMSSFPEVKLGPKREVDPRGEVFP